MAACLLFSTSSLCGGQLGTSPVAWIRGATAAGDLALNNDDYTGPFEDNPNKFTINEGVPQSIVSTELVIPTIASGGITEYAITLGGEYFDDDAIPGVTLDNVYQVQLGFGTGENFVRAQDVAPDLRFDLPESVSPAIEDKFQPPFIRDTPVLKLIDHQTDTLVYQGSSTNGGFNNINFSSSDLFMLPLDIPDLPAFVRDLYSADALAGLAADIPFTIRVSPVVIPEPSAGILAAIGCLLGLVCRRRLQ